MVFISPPCSASVSCSPWTLEGCCNTYISAIFLVFFTCCLCVHSVLSGTPLRCATLCHNLGHFKTKLPTLFGIDIFISDCFPQSPELIFLPVSDQSAQLLST